MQDNQDYIKHNKLKVLAITVSAILGLITITALYTSYRTISKTIQEKEELIKSKNEEVKKMVEEVKSLQETLRQEEENKQELKRSVQEQVEKLKEEKAATNRVRNESIYNKQKADILAIRNVGIYTEAYVYSPPSNVRDVPNGRILDTISTPGYVRVYGNYKKDWYVIEWYGQAGVIHDSQITFNRGY